MYFKKQIFRNISMLSVFIFLLNVTSMDFFTVQLIFFHNNIAVNVLFLINCKAMYV